MLLSKKISNFVNHKGIKPKSAIMKKVILTLSVMSATLSAQAQLQTNNGIEYLQCQARDMSGDFSDLANTYFLADCITGFDLNRGEGLLNWKRYRLAPRQAFNLNGYWPVRMKMLDFPDTQYDNDPNLKIRIQKIDDRTLRVTLFTPDQRFFLAYAGVWGQNITDKEIRNRVKDDPHSLGKWRVDGALPHIDAWYEAFGVKQGDKLFIPKNQRLELW